MRSGIVVVVLILGIIAGWPGRASAGYLSTETDRCGREDFYLVDRFGHWVPVPQYQQSSLVPVASSNITWHCGGPEYGDDGWERTGCPPGTDHVGVYRGANRLVETYCYHLDGRLRLDSESDACGGDELMVFDREFSGNLVADIPKGVHDIMVPLKQNRFYWECVYPNTQMPELRASLGVECRETGQGLSCKPTGNVNLAAVDQALEAFGIGGGDGGYTTCRSGTNTAYISRDMDRDIAIDCWWEPRGAVRSISEATYGQNCGAPAGNATAHVQAICAEKSMCEYNISQENLGDPAYGCPKNFLVSWDCYSGALEKNWQAWPESDGTTMTIFCE